MKLVPAVLLALSLSIAGTSWADPPMKVVYSQTVSTDFTFHWPLQTVRTYNAVQTKPYYYTGRILYLDQNENISKYRHYYSYRVGQNQWGYFFAPGTKLVNAKPYPIFAAPRYFTQTTQMK